MVIMDLCSRGATKKHTPHAIYRCILFYIMDLLSNTIWKDRNLITVANALGSTPKHVLLDNDTSDIYSVYINR